MSAGSSLSAGSSPSGWDTHGRHLGRSGSLRRPGSASRHHPITVGLCAMDKKVKAKPMRELTKRMEVGGEFVFIEYGDDMILNQPISEWPVPDVLIAFFSDGFPLEKCIEYTELHPNMFLLNDVKVQLKLFDRRHVYRMLKDAGVPTPHNVFCNRGEEEQGWPDSKFEEYEDYVVVDGVRINKPFVEKPVSGEDHNVWIYYPTASGGGVKKLFRKIDNKSSEFFPSASRVRRDGSFIYEEFMSTDGKDVKVYAVGLEYAHAEARKSPVVDGVVARTEDGKEVRYPVILSRRQKKIAHHIVAAFKQTVCGFDILIGQGSSIVCDVNGKRPHPNLPTPRHIERAGA